MKRKAENLILIVFVALLVLDYNNKVIATGGTSDTSGLPAYLRLACLVFMTLYLLLSGSRTIFKGRTNVWMFAMMVYMILKMFLQGTFSTTLISMFFPLVTFLFFYDIGNRVNNSLESFGWFSAIMVCILLFEIVSYISVREVIRTDGLMRASDNNGYTILYALPMLLFLRNQKLFFPLFALVALGVLLSGKRGAILALFVVLLFSWKIFFNDNFVSKRMRTYGLLILIIAVALFSWKFGDVFSIIIDRIREGTASDGGSGRNIIYTYYWSGIVDSDILSFLFGHGANSGLSVGLSLMAHQDWLQLWYEYGLCSIFIYLGFYISGFITLKKSPKATILHMAILQILLIHFTKSLVSGTFMMTTSVTYLYALWGAVSGAIDRGSFLCKKQNDGNFCSCYEN